MDKVSSGWEDILHRYGKDRDKANGEEVGGLSEVQTGTKSPCGEWGVGALRRDLVMRKG